MEGSRAGEHCDYVEGGHVGPPLPCQGAADVTGGRSGRIRSSYVAIIEEPSLARARIYEDASPLLPDGGRMEDPKIIAERIIGNVEKVIIGKEREVRLALDRAALPGPRADRGRAGRGQDDPGAQPRRLGRLQLPAHPVHARPAAERRDGRLHLQPEDGRLRVPARADHRAGGAGGRDQPRDAEDAVGAAGGDGGAAGHGRRRDAHDAGAVHRAGDAEPDRVRGHVPAAGGAARPLPAAHPPRLPVA